MRHNRVQNLYAFSNNSQMNNGNWISDAASTEAHKHRKSKQKKKKKNEVKFFMALPRIMDTVRTEPKKEN